MQWVIIPGYNEAARVPAVIRGARRYCRSVVVVDDGSTDRTAAVAERCGATVLRHIINLGKGAATKTGCDYAIAHGASRIVLLDSDGQHEPKEIPRFFRALDRHDIAFGQRAFNKNMPFILKFGNTFIDFMVRLLYGIDLKDTQCGYRAFRASAYRKIRWRASDYSMESEMIANAGKLHLHYTAVPIETIYSDKYKGTTVFDGIKIVFNMLMWRVRGGLLRL